MDLETATTIDTTFAFIGNNLSVCMELHMVRASRASDKKIVHHLQSCFPESVSDPFPSFSLTFSESSSEENCPGNSSAGFGSTELSTPSDPSESTGFFGPEPSEATFSDPSSDSVLPEPSSVISADLSSETVSCSGVVSCPISSFS